MYKRFLLISGALILLILGGTAALNISHDPLFQYHNPFGQESFENADVYYSFNDATYQNPGMAKNFEYDTVITGSSMTQNFDSAYFDELMGVNALKLSLSGGNTKNISAIVETALENNPNVNRIYTSLDYFTLSEDYLAVGNQPPEYLLNNDLFDDLNYIFNKDILFTYTLNDFYMASAYEVSTMPQNEIFMWYGFPYGDSKVLNQYIRPEIRTDVLPADCYYTSAKNNLEAYWIPLISSYPNVEFNFFIPPYSMIYWDSCSRTGTREALIAMWKYACEYLMEYDNVNVFCFAGIEPLVENLWNYKDEAHYHLRINDYMTECFANGEHLLTSDNLEKTFAELSKLTAEYDYDAYFNNTLRTVSDLTTYLTAIDYENCLVLLSVGAECYQQLPAHIQASLADLGIDSSVSETCKYHIAVKENTYITSAVISDEQKLVTLVADESQIAFEEIPIKYDTFFSIRIDGIEYSQNSKDISFIIYDVQSNRVVDSVSFDPVTFTANRLNPWSDFPEHREYLRQKLTF